MHKSWEDNISEEKQWVKININREKSSYIEKDCFKKSQNHCSRSDRTAETNIHNEHPVCTKTVQRQLHKSASTVGLQLLNLWLLTVMVRCVSDGVTTIKPGHQTTGNARVIWSDEFSFTLFPTSGRAYVWRTPKEAYNPECLLWF
jgi:hypothetical protein